MADVAWMLAPLQVLHRKIRDAVVASCEANAGEELARVESESPADTIYTIDRVGEALLVEFVDAEIASRDPVMLIAEGLDRDYILPVGTRAEDVRWRIIVDPIDGTRGLMYQKRSAWVLTGVAPNRGAATSLADIQLALQTEIPLVKQHLSDELWAMKGGGAHAVRYNRTTGDHTPFELTPSTANTLRHGFSTITRFFPGARIELSEIDEEVVAGAVGPIEAGRALCFEDQYISSGGQLYELMVGHDRFVADLRQPIESLLNSRGVTSGICCHPYDLCAELIAREAGVIVTDPSGGNLSAPLTVDEDVAWVGYANQDIRSLVEPHLQEALRKRSLI